MSKRMTRDAGRPAHETRVHSPKSATSPHPNPKTLSLLLLAVLVIASAYPYLIRGHPNSDAWPHLARIKIVHDAITQGFSPYYTFMFYSGFPDLRLYSPLFEFLGGAFTVLTGGNLLLGLKILLFVLHILSAWAMYRYLRYRTHDDYAAAFGTVVYSLVPWRVIAIVFINYYPQALFYVLLPLTFLALEQLFDRRQSKYALLLGLWMALMIVSHLVYALLAVPFLVIWSCWGHDRIASRDTIPDSERVWVTSRQFGSSPQHPLLAIGTSLAGAALLSAFFLIPFLTEYRIHAYPQASLNLPAPDIRVLLGFKLSGRGVDGFYLGWGIIALVVASLYVVLRLPKTGHRRKIPVLIGLALSLLLVFSPAILGSRQTLVTAGLPPVRLLIYFVFFAGILAASGFQFVRRKLANRPGTVTALFSVCALVMLVDFLIWLPRFSFPVRENYMPAVLEQMYQTVAAENPSRVLNTAVPQSKIDDWERLCRLPALGFVYYDLPTPLGVPYHQFAPRSMRYAYPWIDYLAADLGNGRVRALTANSLKVLSLLGISHLITSPAITSHGDTSGGKKGVVSGFYKEGLSWDQHFAGLIRPGTTAPLLLARTAGDLVLAGSVVRPWAAETLVQRGVFLVAGDWQELLDSIEIDSATHRLNFIPAADREGETLPGTPALSVLNRRIRNQDVQLEVNVTGECFLRLSVSYYPYLRVFLDGRPVDFFSTSDHFIYLRCPAGTHRIRVTAPLTPVRRLMFAVSGISWLVLAGALVTIWRRRKRGERRQDST